jgi:hypothetical protein
MNSALKMRALAGSQASKGHPAGLHGSNANGDAGLLIKYSSCAESL